MKILVIRFSSAGDIVLTTPFLRAVRRRFPEAEIHFMTKRAFAPLVEHSPHLNRIIAIESGWGLRELAAMKAGLRRENGGDYDILFDLHNSLRSRYVRRGLARSVAVFRKPTLAKWLLVHRKIDRLTPVIPIPLRYLAVGAPFGLVDDGEGAEIVLGATHSPISPVAGRPTIALAPGARHMTKQWPPEYFIRLGQRLIDEHDARIVLVGSPDERDLAARIASALRGEVIDLTGRTTLLEAAAALDACDLAVTNDSAMAHIAAARKRPVVAIFGSTVQQFGFAPFRTRSTVVEVEGLYCRPCTSIGRDACPEGHFRCMREIDAERVMIAAMSIMNDARIAG
jgi:heptosyltransferase-2